ncbi:hypothetical protein V5O48_005163 [Marasmius crinis-equi]|uniref:Uncharacterized protein n=1 Tax=Marasmius crinis-equi TaxID=585013 RepID=A0ABR3FNU0_9AGAR
MRELRAQADADIRKYLRHEFTRFPELHPDAGIEESWPGEDAIDKLTINADGHFVYIKTAVKYVAGDDPYLLTPQDRLAVVLRTSETSLYPDLSTMDQLYQHILQPFMGIRERILLPVLQLIISPHINVNTGPGPTFISEHGLRCRSQNAIAKLLKLHPRQVSTILYRLQSILHVPDDDHREDVSVLHASFSDFLTDKHRSLHFHIEPLRGRVYFGMLSQCLLPILNNMTQKHAAGERMSPEITNFELYSIDVWLFVGAIFNIHEVASKEMPQDDYIPTKELLHAINEFDVYHYINMLVDRDYMCHIYTVFKDPSTYDGMDVCATVLFENMPCLRRLYLQCTECTQLVPGSLSPYPSQFCSQLSPFIENHRSLFEDGWLAKLPKICTSGTLSQLALLIAVVCSPFPIGYRYKDLVNFLNLPKDTDNSESHIPFKIYRRGTDLLDLPEGSDVEYISCEKGRIFVDGMRTLGHNLSGDFYSEAARKRGIRAFMTGQFTGLDEWNREVSMLLDLWPSVDGYSGGEDRDWTSHLEDLSFDDEDVVSSPELAIPDTKLEGPEDILDYGREFPWRLKTPPRERSGFEQPKSAGELPQTDNKEGSELCMVQDGLSVVEGDQNHEKDKVTTPQLNNEPSIKAPGSEQDQPTGLADELLSIQDAPRPPDVLKVRFLASFSKSIRALTKHYVF